MFSGLIHKIRTARKVFKVVTFIFFALAFLFIALVVLLFVFSQIMKKRKAAK